MSTNDSSGGGRPRQVKANLHPGRIILDSQIKRRTPAEKHADDLRVHEDRDARETAIQQGLVRVSEMEAAMEIEQASQDGSKAKPVRPRRGTDQRRLTPLSGTPHVDVDVGADPYHEESTAVVAPAVIVQGDKPSLSGSNSRALRRQNAMADVELTRVPGQEKSHQRSVDFPSLTITPNKRALLLGRINNWANEVRPGVGSCTPQNSAASDSQTGGKSYPPSSTVPSLTTKATSVNSAASDAARSYRETSAPRVIGFPDPGDEGDAQDPAAEDVDSTPNPIALPVRLRVAGYHQQHKTVERTTSTNVNPSTSDDDFDRPISDVARTSLKCRHAGYSDSRFVSTSDADDVDDEVSNTGHRNVGSDLPQTTKVLRVTAMTNVNADKPAKKPQTSLHDDITAEETGHSAPASTITSHVSTTGTSNTGSGRVRYINGHLPSSLQENRKWTKLVLPALVTWARSLGDPWVIPDQDLMRALQIIITTVNPNFGDLSAIRPGAPVFVLATRRLSVWRSNFGSTALAIMAHFLASSTDDTQPPVRETCNELLDGFAFLFQDLDPSKPENAYRSQFLLQLLAHTHLRPCIGCPDVPRLDTDALKEHGVKGAISLSCAALERAIRLFQRGQLHVDDQFSSRGKATARTPLKLNKSSGKETSTALSFSEQNWGACTPSAFVTPTMDSLMAEDGTSPDDVLTDDLLVSANQRMSISFPQSPPLPVFFTTIFLSNGAHSCQQLLCSPARFTPSLQYYVAHSSFAFI
ncbi:hypothetical protein EDD16DRAFT_1710592 [Pisolithus croceorrhizus]|nr:hypothetical protein EDD16DRAFT_1710592 [Pisolithus croceorrhizus]